MRYLALGRLLFVPLAHAGESPPYGPGPSAGELARQWIYCRLGVGTGTAPRTNQMTVCTSIMPMGPRQQTDYNLAFSDYVSKTYGIPQHRAQCTVAKNEADARQALEYLTSNNGNLTIVPTGWTY
ncbi:MAG: hypothetical protein WD929_01135 [Steroidobacteraceae bacterium]